MLRALLLLSDSQGPRAVDALRVLLVALEMGAGDRKLEEVRAHLARVEAAQASARPS